MRTMKLSVVSWRFALVLLAVCGAASPSFGQLQGIGPALYVNAGANFSGIDLDVDPVNQVYLVVGNGLSGQAAFVDFSGGPVGSAFSIFAGYQLRVYPRVRYSPDVAGGAGGFLVTWYEPIGTTTSYALHAILVAYPTGPLGAERVLVADTGLHLNSFSSSDVGTAQAIAYSPTSREFLVTWQQRTSAGDDTLILAQRVAPDGTSIGAVISIAANNGCFWRFASPSASWNPSTDEFGVSFSGEDLATGGGEPHFATVRAGGTVSWPSACSRNPALPLQDIYATDVDFNLRTGHWMMAWLTAERASPTVPRTYASEVSAAGTFLKVTPVSTAMTSRTIHDIASITLSYNPRSGTFLLSDFKPFATTPGLQCQSRAVLLGAELDAHGVPLGAEVEFNQPFDFCGPMFPRAVAVPGLPRWAIVFVEYGLQILDMRLQLVGTSTPPSLTMNVVAVGDMDRDHHPDLVRRSAADGVNGITMLDATTALATVRLPTVAAGSWNIVGAADFNRDGWLDLLWRDSASGSNVIWYMSGTLINATAFLPTVSGPWQIAGLADFNGDGWPDVVWRHPVTGSNQLWLLNNNAIIGSAFLPSVVSTSWAIAGVTDLNGDGNPDLLWRNPSTGVNQIWYMTGVSIGATAFLPTVPGANWVIVGLADVNGDGQADVLWRNADTDDVSVWYLKGTTIIGSALVTGA